MSPVLHQPSPVPIQGSVAVHEAQLTSLCQLHFHILTVDIDNDVDDHSALAVPIANLQSTSTEHDIHAPYCHWLYRLRLMKTAYATLVNKVLKFHG